jgi:tetraacyldisaccharide 4'-kinase
VAARRSFPDHHRFGVSDITGLLADADREHLALVTTEKDLARLAGDPAAGELLARATALPVTLKVHDPVGFERMVLGTVCPRRTADGSKASP